MHSTAISSPLTILKKFKFSFEKTHAFLQKKKQILYVLRNVAISVAFYGKLAKRGEATLQYFPSTVAKKWLWNEMAENF